MDGLTLVTLPLPDTHTHMHTYGDEFVSKVRMVTQGGMKHTMKHGMKHCMKHGYETWYETSFQTCIIGMQFMVRKRLPKQPREPTKGPWPIERPRGMKRGMKHV